MRSFSFALTAAAAVLLSGCVATTAIETGKLPTAAEAQQQLAADVAALKLAGCVVDEAGTVAQPVIQAEVDANGQRIANLVDQTGAKLCSAASPPAASSVAQ